MPTQEPKHWTILIFMVVDEDALAPYALIDLRDIRRLGTVSGFNVITEVRWHNAEPERYELKEGELDLLATPRIGMGAGRTPALREFLLDALRDHPAEHYVLMLWGHAYGFGYGRPDFDRVAFQDLARVFDEFARHRDGTKLDILAANSCRIGKVETIYELHDVVKYLVSSQVVCATRSGDGSARPRHGDPATADRPAHRTRVRVSCEFLCLPPTEVVTRSARLVGSSIFCGPPPASVRLNRPRTYCASVLAPTLRPGRRESLLFKSHRVLYERDMPAFEILTALDRSRRRGRTSSRCR